MEIKVFDDDLLDTLRTKVREIKSSNLLSDICLWLDLVNNKLILTGYSHQELLELDEILFAKLKLPNYNLKESLINSVVSLRKRYKFMPVKLLASHLRISEPTFKKYLKMSHEKEHIT